MSHAIDITVIVDVIQALSRESLEGSVYMMDTNPKSKHQGTDRLMTKCHPGQVINWKIRAVDVQTQVKILKIGLLREDDGRLFAEGCGGSEDYADHWWSGRVMVPEGRYRYRIQMQLGNGRHSVLDLESPVLSVRERQHASWSRQSSCWEIPAFYPPYWPCVPSPAYVGHCPPYPPPAPYYPPLPPCPPMPCYPSHGSVWPSCYERRGNSCWDPCDPWDDWSEPCYDGRLPRLLHGRVEER